ncbi:MAG: LuxR C-terminal-related transcriptional regulator [Muribaculaceae bacterium]|nr:LuxR C-terminal-related transcriptional regulator [Muribaculaceae bacterium]
MENQRILNKLLRTQDFSGSRKNLQQDENNVRGIIEVEKVLAVISDMADGTSRIYDGGFGNRIGLKDYSHEDSIWETGILSMMSDTELEEKFIAELRFYHYLRHQPKMIRQNYYMISKLRFNPVGREAIDILHRMFYVYDDSLENVIGAICLYGPLTFDFNGRSHAVNSLTGIAEPLTSSANSAVLSKRERQILILIASGLKSADIAERLNISKHTVSRHRQEILARLQVKNSIEACRLAKSMELI